MTVTLALTIMLIATIVRGLISLSVAASLGHEVVRAAIAEKDKGQIAGIAVVVSLCSAAMIAGWIYVGFALDQPLIVAITAVSVATSALGALVRWASKPEPKAAPIKMRAA